MAHIQIIPDLYLADTYKSAQGGLSLWHLIRSVDMNGCGRAILDIKKICELFNIHVSTLYRWLKQGVEADLFVYKNIGDNKIWFLYRSWVKVVLKANLKQLINSFVPIAALKNGRAAAVLSIIQHKQSSMFREAKKENPFAEDLSNIILRKGKRNCKTNYPIELATKEEIKYVEKLPGINVPVLLAPKSYSGKSSPLLYETQNHICLRGGYSAYGISQNKIAERVKLSEREIRNIIKSEVANICGLKVKRLCVAYGTETPYSSFYDKLDLSFIKKIKKQEKKGLNPLMLDKKHNEKIIEKYHNQFISFMEENDFSGFGNYNALKSKQLSKFKLVKVKINQYKTKMKPSFNNGKQFVTNKVQTVEGYLLIENLTNVYNAQNIVIDRKLQFMMQKILKNKKKDIKVFGGTLSSSYNYELDNLLNTNNKTR